MTATQQLEMPVPRERRIDYLNIGRTVGSWLATTDHKRIGVLFMGGVSLSLLLGGIFAMLIRIEHLTPGPTIMTALTYNRMFTLHGVIMVWLFMIPSIPTVFGNFFLPIMVGARDVAFPRLNLASFYVYVVGAAIVLIGMAAGGADTGWTFYAPYASRSPTAVAPVVFGIFVLGLSSIASGINFIVTVHTLRTKGMRWRSLPLFVWNIYATSIIQVLATPVLGLALVVVGLDHSFDWGLFDPQRGGDPVLFQHLFWFYSHPAVYIMVLPAMGVITEVLCCFARKNPLSYDLLVISALGIAFVGFLTWGHHMFVSGMSIFDAGAFGLLSMLVAVFSAIKTFTWIGTLYKGSITLATPMVYVFAFLFLFIFGGMTGVATATSSLDVHWHDTYFIVAHFHFIMVGGTLTAFLSALHYWFPKMTGRRYNESWGIATAVLVFAGFIFTFVPQFLLGNAGMPRRYFIYPEHFTTLHVLSSAGAFVLATGLVITLVNLGAALVTGEHAGDNPWASSGYEWRTHSPPPPHNFEDKLDLSTGPYDYTGGAR